MGSIETKNFKTKVGKELLLRTALPSDAENVLKFTETVLDEAPYLLFEPGEFKITLEKQAEQLEKIYTDNNKLAIIVEYNGEVIGLLDFINGNRNRIKHQGSFGMSVIEGYRGQGIGKALLTSLLGWAKANESIEKINLEVFAENINAIGLYKDLGFEQEGIKRKAIKINDNNYSDLILMGICV